MGVIVTILASTILSNVFPCVWSSSWMGNLILVFKIIEKGIEFILKGFLILI